MIRKLTEEEAKSLWRNEGNETYVFIEESGWKDDGKYSYAYKIYKDKEDLFWLLNANRTGSYCTDYEYNYDTELRQVEKYTKTIEDWRAVE